LEEHYGFTCRGRREGNTKLLRLSAGKMPVA
jgi:hypothetical protein